MSPADSFTNLIRQVRAGDATAADTLWRRCEPVLRREIRLRLRDPRLRQRIDEDDVCQSVMASFFVRAAAGQFDLEGPEQLQHLLAQMGRNKLATQARLHLATNDSGSYGALFAEAAANTDPQSRYHARVTLIEVGLDSAGRASSIAK